MGRFIKLLLLNIIAALATGIVVFGVLYEVSIRQFEEHLLTLVESRRALVVAVANFDNLNITNYAGGARSATLSQIKDAHEHLAGFGKTGEFSIAELRGDQIVYLFRQRETGLTVPPPIPYDSKFSEPLRRALNGQTGVMQALDFHGDEVLAAYAPIPQLGLGLIARINISEVREPYIRAAILSLLAALLIFSITTFIFINRVSPIVAELKKSLLLERTLNEAQTGAIQSIASAIEARDPYTAGHQKRTSELAVEIGLELGWDEFKIDGLKLGCMIHDIGEIAVPAEYLSRPGTLSETEFEIVKSHCQIGADIMSKSEYPWPIAKMIAQHHERNDGSGYPLGLRGDEIIDEAKVIAVADVVEAICSHRPYRPGQGLSAAIEEIYQNRGAKYEPEIVDACIRVISDNKIAWLA